MKLLVFLLGLLLTVYGLAVTFVVWIVFFYSPNLDWSVHSVAVLMLLAWSLVILATPITLKIQE